MHELMFQAGVKGMSERSELIPCIYIYMYDRLLPPYMCTSQYKCTLTDHHETNAHYFIHYWKHLSYSYIYTTFAITNSLST